MEPVKTASEQDNRDDVAFRRGVAKGIETAKLGRTVPYADVRKWLLSWGKEDELPPSECG